MTVVLFSTALVFAAGVLGLIGLRLLADVPREPAPVSGKRYGTFALGVALIGVALACVVLALGHAARMIG